MTVYAITDTKKGEQGLRLLIFKNQTTRKKCTPETLLNAGVWYISQYRWCVYGKLTPQLQSQSHSYDSLHRYSVSVI